MLNSFKSKPFPPLFRKRTETSFYFSYAELMLGVILNIMKHQSSVIGIGNLELNIHVCLGSLLLLLVGPSPSPVLRFSGAAMMVQSIFRKQTCWFITSGSTCHHQELGGGGGADILFQNYQFKRQPLNVSQSELSLNRTYRADIYYADWFCFPVNRGSWLGSFTLKSFHLSHV